MENTDQLDVIIIGGSYAGLSAGLALGRSLRKTLIIDEGRPCNRQTPHSHNFLTQDGKPPAEIHALAKKQVEEYKTVRFLSERAMHAEKKGTEFVVTTHSNQMFTARKLILATGIRDLLPDIKGLSECWGISVIHCPYCHGYEFRGQKTGIMANGDHAFHLASLVNNLTGEVTILTTGDKNFSDEQLDALARNGIAIEESEVAQIVHDQGRIRQVVFKNGKEMTFAAVYASVPFEQPSDIPAALGCELTEQGHIKVDVFQSTTVEGVYACGDNATPFRSVAAAVANGNAAGAVANMELTKEQFC